MTAQSGSKDDRKRSLVDRIEAVRSQASKVAGRRADEIPPAIAELLGPERVARIVDSRVVRAIRRSEAVERLSRQGLSAREIAASLGISLSHTHRLRGRLGVNADRHRR